LFINIKVDREERPDLDKIYQTAFQMLHQPIRWLAADDVPDPRRSRSLLSAAPISPKRPATECRPSPISCNGSTTITASTHPTTSAEQNRALLEALRAEIAALLPAACHSRR
jgi:hypothetical protein